MRSYLIQRKVNIYNISIEDELQKKADLEAINQRGSVVKQSKIKLNKI
jgi:hypothetical protein